MGSSTNSSTPERRISRGRITNVKRQTIGLAEKLQKSLNALTSVNGELAKFGDDPQFSAKKVALGLRQESLEAGIKNLQAKFDTRRTVYSSYLEKNSKLMNK
ncbi:MAG: hypothetical protein NTX65_16540 [Ignavibacteriales bacterium]|nr:hypothetical protein [Ignavibacteriales bacterium]